MANATEAPAVQQVVRSHHLHHQTSTEGNGTNRLQQSLAFAVWGLAARGRSVGRARVSALLRLRRLLLQITLYLFILPSQPVQLGSHSALSLASAEAPANVNILVYPIETCTILRLLEGTLPRGLVLWCNGLNGHLRHQYPLWEPGRVPAAPRPLQFSAHAPAHASLPPLRSSLSEANPGARS